MRHLFVALMLAAMAPAEAEPRDLGLEAGGTYYYDHFDPLQKPWMPGSALNIEEVFKNYQYYEIKVDGDGSRIQVQQYVQGQAQVPRRYRLGDDGSLEEIAP